MVACQMLPVLNWTKLSLDELELFINAFPSWFGKSKAVAQHHSAPIAIESTLN